MLDMQVSRQPDHSTTPMVLLWGPAAIAVNNDFSIGYIPVTQAFVACKHPHRWGDSDILYTGALR